MLHDGYFFDFPGRGYELKHADLDAWLPVALEAVRAIADVVSPTVVELTLGDIGEAKTIHHLVADDRIGGAYQRSANETSVVDVIDATALRTWLEAKTAHGATPIDRLAVADGWFPVDAQAGDVVRLHTSNGAQEVVVLERRGVSCVRGPNERVIAPPVAFSLDCATNTLRIAVHWSPWTDAQGVGRSRFAALLEQLAAADWQTVRAPSSEELDWRRWQRSRSVAPLHARNRDENWIELPARKVRLGLDETELERVAQTLLAIDRADRAGEQSLGFTAYDATARLADIRKFLATAVGRRDAAVGPCEIMRRPVTNAMWRAYMAKTGAARPSSWRPQDTPPPNAPVTGVSRQEAEAFAAHHGWRLASEAEWELAATGGDRRWFPWGDWSPLGERLDRGPVPPSVGQQQQLASPLGVEDLLGGTGEYVADVFGPYPRADMEAFVAAAGTWEGQACVRGLAPRSPPCIPARRGVPEAARFTFARFRCVRS